MSVNLVLLGLATTTSPLFLLAAVLMMSTSMKVRTAWAAVLGWMVSIGASAAAILVIGSALRGSQRGGPSPRWMGAFDAAIGIVLALLALREWRRYRSPSTSATPKWFDRIGSMSILAAFGIGVFMPANVLAYAAGNEIAQQHLGGDGRWLALAGYIAVGSLIEIGPVLWFTLSRTGRERTLPKWNTWLDGHWQEVLALLFTVVSAFLLVKGGVAIARSA